MNSKAGLILRIVAGMYLVFSGATLLRQMLTLRPSDYILKSAIAVLFIVVGVWYGYRNIKATYYFVKGQTEPEKEKTESVEDSVLYTKPEYDASKYRTAPMPVVEEQKKEPEVESKKEEKQEAVKDTKESKNEAVLDQKTTVLSDMPINVQAGAKKDNVEEESGKDPVKLAIEIMKDEDEDRMEKEAEELESDFEER